MADTAGRNIGKTARDWVLRLSSGDVQPGEMDALKVWLATDPDHRRAFERERRLWQDLDQVKAAFVAAEDAQAGAVALPTSNTGSVRQVMTALYGLVGLRPRAGMAMVAACCLLLVFAGDIRNALLTDASTAAGEQRMVTLPDGSRAFLNTDTALDIAYTETERRIHLLRGEAWFDVVPDPGHPFVVQALDGSARALGTAYAVREDAGEVRVGVTHGEVRVQLLSDDVPGDQGNVLNLTAGKQAVYGNGHGPRMLADGAVIAGWRSGDIVIDDLPLSSALAELSRYYPGRIMLVGAGEDARNVSGVFDVGAVDEAVRALAAMHGLRVISVTKYLLILA